MDVLWTPPKAKADPNIRTAYMSNASVEDDTGQLLCKRFELLAAIGFGATAAVYRALDRETKSEVAVKILYKSLRGDSEAIRYFAQEGKLAARIVHPHLLRAHYYGQRRGAPFIVFELVPGTSLSQVAAMRPMPWRRLATIVLQVLDALAKLHQEGVIHGDIQPDNVIVQQTTLGQDFAKVIDLGFATARACSRLTLVAEPSAEVHGTAGFIAPERLAGLEPDGRADLYSVGALMYFLLTTRPVPDISLAPEELGVPAPSIMAPGAGIPRAIDVIVMRALSDVDDRYATAAGMAQALRDALTQPILPAAVVHVPESTPPATVAPATPIEINQGPPADAVEVAEPGELPTALLHDVPQRAATRTPVAVGLGVGLVLCLSGVAALWRVGAALDDGPIVADEAMNSAAPSGTEATVLHRPASAPVGPSLLPPVPVEPEPTATVAKTGSAAPRADDPRVSEIRRAINRCNPLVPYSVSTITVKTKPSGKTLILFGAHEARGQLGTCVAQIAARTKIAKGERLSFKL
jgi:serine/threonine-protein kinase